MKITQEEKEKQLILEIALIIQTLNNLVDKADKSDIIVSYNIEEMHPTIGKWFGPKIITAKITKFLKSC